MLWVLAACGLLVRLWASAHASAYVDEGLTYYVASQGPHAIANVCRGDFILPGFYLPLWPIAALTDQRFLLRLPSSLCGALCAPLLVVIGRRLGQPRAGLAAAWLYAVAYPVVLVEAQIRLYGLLDLLLLLSLALWLEGRPRAQRATLLVLPWVHIMGTAAVLGWGLWGWLRRERSLWQGAALGLLLFSPWLLYTLTGPTEYLQRSNRQPVSILQLLESLSYLTGLPAAWPTAPVPLVAGVLATLGALWGLRSLRQRAVVAGLILFPLLPALLASLRGTQEFQARYLVPSAGLIYLSLLAGLPRRLQAALAGLLVLVNLGLSLLLPVEPRLMNQDWDSAARFVRAYSHPGDVIAAFIPYSLLGFNYAYAGGTCYLNLEHPAQLDIRYRPTYQGLEQLPLVPALLGPGLEQRLAGKSVFLILNQEGPAGAAIREWFGQRFLMEREFTTRSLYSWGEIYVYLLRPDYARARTSPPPGAAPASAAPR